MKQAVAVLLLVAVAAVGFSCSKAPEAGAPAGTTVQAPAEATGPMLKAVFGSVVATKPIDHALAMMKGDSEVTIRVYSFKTAETWPGEAAYAVDDFYLHVTITDTVALHPGEYSGRQLDPGLSTKSTSYGFMPARGSIVITEIGNGKIKGEFRLDDSYVKVSGPFEIPLT